MNDKFKMTLEENMFLAKKILVESIYNVAKLEGVNTTFTETEAILDGVNVPGAKLDDIQVILNLRDAWRDILANVATTKIDLDFVKMINSSVSRNESLAWGKLRTGKVGISGTNHKPDVPDEQKVAGLIDDLLQDESKTATERAIDLALYIMYNQLFWDGNKRTANLVANAVLIQNGVGILNIAVDNIAEFNRLLKLYYDTGDSISLKKFLYNVAIVDFETKNVPVNVPVNSTEAAVLAILGQNKSATYDDIAVVIGKTTKTVQRAIGSLKDRGLVTRVGSDKSGYWIVENQHAE